MDEWTVVTALVVLLGLIVTVAKPLLSLNSTIIRLTDAVKVLEKNLDAIAGKNSEQHARIWERIEEIEARLGQSPSYGCSATVPFHKGAFKSGEAKSE